MSNPFKQTLGKKERIKLILYVQIYTKVKLSNCKDSVLDHN